MLDPSIRWIPLSRTLTKRTRRTTVCRRHRIITFHPPVRLQRLITNQLRDERDHLCPQWLSSSPNTIDEKAVACTPRQAVIPCHLSCHQPIPFSVRPFTTLTTRISAKDRWSFMRSATTCNCRRPGRHRPNDPRGAIAETRINFPRLTVWAVRGRCDTSRREHPRNSNNNNHRFNPNCCPIMNDASSCCSGNSKRRQLPHNHHRSSNNQHPWHPIPACPCQPMIWVVILPIRHRSSTNNNP